MQTSRFIENELAKSVRPIAVRSGALKNTVMNGWKRIVASGEYNAMSQANERLRKTEERLMFGRFNLGNTDEVAINKYCEYRSKKTLEIIGDFPIHLRICDIVNVISSAAKLKEHGLEIELPDDDLKAYDCLFGLYRRVITAAWWRGKLKRAQKKAIESVARDYGLVNKKMGAYVSDLSLDLRRKQEVRNQRILKNTLAVNDDGESYTLAELQALSISNPEVRRAELMSRIRGFEMMADQQGHEAVFWTITCPSKYHSHHVNGSRNKKYNKEEIRDAQDYLCVMWAAFRSWCNRNAIEFYGFRVAEPHHDGCPHWHVLVFGESDNLEAASKELRERALRVEGGEQGAIKNRFTAKKIYSGISKDGRKLSAAGYIAKYIAKSIDGFSVDGDSSVDMNGERFEMNQDSETGASRVVAWARTNGIRQFQQIGGAYVSVWREIRKLHGECDDDGAREIIEAVEEKTQVDAAVAWAVFNYLNGSGRDQRLKLWRDDIRKNWQNIVFFEKKMGVDHSSENAYSDYIDIMGFDDEMKSRLHPISSFGRFGNTFKNQYGEVVSKIKGLVFDGTVQIETRLREWFIVSKNEVKEVGEKNGSGFLEFRYQLAKFKETLGLAAKPPLDSCQ